MKNVGKKARALLAALLAISVVFSLNSIIIFADDAGTGQNGPWCNRTEFNAWLEQSQDVVKGADHVIGPEGDLNTGSYYNVILPGETVAIVPMEVDVGYGIQGGIMSFGFTLYQLDEPVVLTEDYGVSSLPKTGYPEKTNLTPIKTDTVPVPYGARGEDRPDDPVKEISGATSVQYTSLYRNDTGLPIVIRKSALNTKYRDAGQMWGGDGPATKFQGSGRINYAPEFFFLENEYDIRYQGLEENEGNPLIWPDGMEPLPTKFYIDNETHTYRFANPICKGCWFDMWASDRSNNWYYGESCSRGGVWTNPGLETKWYPTYTEYKINAVERIKEMSSLRSMCISPVMYPRFTSYYGSCKTLCFDAQGGTVNGKPTYWCECSDGVGVASAYTFNVDIGKIIPKKAGCTFTGWCTDPKNPKETLITDTAPEHSSSWVRGQDHVDLYATWSETPKAVDIKSASVSGISDKTYTGKKITQKPVVKVNGKKLVENTDYSVSYKNNKYVGTATITITGMGNYKGTKKITFAITPKGTTLSKVAAASKGFTAKWKTQTTQTTGYQLQYSTSSSFKSGNKSVTISKNTAASKSISKLKAKKTYYVRIRTYKKVSGKTYYSDWSKAKKVTTKQ